MYITEQLCKITARLEKHHSGFVTNNKKYIASGYIINNKSRSDIRQRKLISQVM